MAADLILELEGVPGECKKAGFEGKIDIDSWGWSGHRPGAFAIGGGGTTGAASVSDISVQKHYDKASPQMQYCLLTGKHIPSGTIHCRKSVGDTQQVYLEVKLTDIVVTSFSEGGSGGSELIHEGYNFNFAKIEIKYKEQQADGSLTDAGELKFDIPKGEPM